MTINKYITPIGTGYVYNSYFGISPHPILIFYTSCSSYQNNLFNCYMNQFPYLYPHCNNYQEAGVKCECELLNVINSLHFCSHKSSSMY